MNHSLRASLYGVSVGVGIIVISSASGLFHEDIVRWFVLTIIGGGLAQWPIVSLYYRSVKKEEK